MFVDSKERNYQEKGRTKQNNDFVASEPDKGRYICAGTDGGGRSPARGSPTAHLHLILSQLANATK